MASHDLMTDRESLAVDFFLLAHDPFDEGRLTINAEILGYGLVGGKFADLILKRWLRVENDRVLASTGGVPDDEIDSYVVDAVRSQRQPHTVRSWVDPLQDELYEFIGDRVVTWGIMRREQAARRIGRGRQPDRFPATDLLTVTAPQQRLEQMMRSPRDLTLSAGMLAALLNVLGIDWAAAPDVDRTTLREIIVEIEDNLPADLRCVYDAIKALTGEVSLRLR
jgi:Golgi phosphoprotein 3 (GPP34)